MNWDALNEQIIHCARCSRLRKHCQSVAQAKKRAYADWDYWGRPVPNFGDRRARMVIVGLAPAAHGANRTGRMFTGDRSGDWLYHALFQSGFATQGTSKNRADGLQLVDCAITAVAHCAPPQNRLTAQERHHCRDWLQATFDLLPVRIVLALGQVAWNAAVAECRAREWYQGRSPRFAHASHVSLAGHRWLLGSYHPSQQNTFTGRLTKPMFHRIFRTARKLLDE